MTTTLSMFTKGMLALVLSVVLSNAVSADDFANERTSGTRIEIWLALTNWQALGDLDPVAGGSFKSVGFGIGASAHWPLRSVSSADLMLGVEGAVAATDSDIPVYLDDLLARDAYLATSLKWTPRNLSALSMDVGVAYHLLDIAQLRTSYQSSLEFESWEETALGPFIGMTWEPGSADETSDAGLAIGLRAHFLDFGKVHDEQVLASVVLGREAGELDGPLVMLQIGYRWR